YRTLFDHAADPIAVLDPKGNLLDLNATFVDKSGHKREEMIGKNVFDCGIMTEPSARNLRSRFTAMLAGEPWRTHEMEGVEKDGKIVPYEVNALPIMKNENLVAVQAICRDISDRKHVEEAFRRENEKFQLLVEASPFAVSIVDRKGGYTYVNPRFTEMLGYTLEDIPNGRAWFEKAYPDEAMRKKAMADWIRDLKSFKPGKFRPRTYSITCKDGSQKIVTVRSVTLEMGDQFVIYEDDSERMAAMEMLKESRERYQRVFENTGTAMGIFDEDMTISMANTGLETLTGYSKEELEGKMKWTQFVTEEDLNRMIGYHNQRRKESGEPPTEYEFRFVDRNGKVKDIFIRAELLPGTRKSIASMVDITARKKSEEALQRSEERYRTILESIEEGYFEVDLRGNLTFFNDALCRISGYSREQMIGVSNKDYTTPASAKRMYQVFNQVYRTGKPATSTDHEIIRRDGSPSILAISASLMQDSSGNPVGFRGLVRDITEHKRAVEALQESEEKYRQLMEHAPAGIYELDFKEQKFVTANDVMCEYTGYSKEEFLALSPLDILTEDSRRLFLERMSKASSGEKVPETVEFSIRAKGGREFWVILNTRYVYENGIPTGATVVVHDITERKLAEEALRKSEEKYRFLVDHAND
ncbi:MAG: PAS domain S-box protein, partial [Desulfobacterales bacterium]|nr:PAS domain S-box protein [Desulfobacterales bacterium]